MSIRFIETPFLNTTQKLARKNLKTKDFSGTEIDLNDSAYKTFKQIGVKGNSTQETTEGRQLFDNSAKRTWTSTLNAYEKIDTGIRLIHRESTSSGSNLSSLWKLVDLTNYIGKTVRMKCDFTIHGGQKSGYAIGVCNTNGSEREVKSSVTSTSGTTINFVVPEFQEGDTQIYLAVWLYLNRTGASASAAQDDYTDFTNIMVTIDNEDMTWEEYTGGQASPNRDYEQPVNSAGDNLNLFDKEGATSSALQADGTILSSSTLTTSDFIEISPTKTYYKTITASARVKLYDKNKNVISTSSMGDISNFGNAQSFSIPSGFETAKYIRITMENQYVNTFKLEKGNKATPYSPYGMGSIKEEVINKNLWNGINRPSLLVGRLNENGILVASNTWRTMYISALPNTKYTISNLIRDNGAVYEWTYDKDMNPIRSVGRYHNYTFTTPENTAFLGISVDAAERFNFQIEQGPTATEFQDHAEQKYTIPTQQPMRSIGNVRDGFAKVNEIWNEVHYIVRYIFTGAEIINKLNSNYNVTFQVTGLGLPIKTPATSNDIMLTLSNYFKGIYSANTIFGTNVTGLGVTPSGNTNIGLGVDSEITTVDAFKTMITEKYTSGNPLYIDYVLSTPTYLPCTQEQIEALEAFEKARTYKNVTHIYSEDDVPAYVEGKYYAKC